MLISTVILSSGVVFSIYTEVALREKIAVIVLSSVFTTHLSNSYYSFASAKKFCPKYVFDAVNVPPKETIGE